MAIVNALRELRRCGQSPWLDNIGRALARTGKMRNLMDAGVMGVTSNPSIFEKAIKGSKDYKDDITALARQGRSAMQIYEALAIQDVREAADIFMKVYKDTNGGDGFISLEVPPQFAHLTDETVDAARDLVRRVDRPNLMIKVPATDAGVFAIERLTSMGINVNATLIFSLQQYEAAANAYLRGIGELIARGGDPAKAASVASVFISRIDTAVDKILAEKIAADQSKKEELEALMGKAAVANSKLVYRSFIRIFHDEEESVYERMRGIIVQRPLWASTGTKNPAYSDIKYIAELVGRETVNTIPDATLAAFMDHGGNVQWGSITGDVEGAERVIDTLSSHGINVNEVCDKLMNEGLVAFENSFNSLIDSIEQARRETLGIGKEAA